MKKYLITGSIIVLIGAFYFYINQTETDFLTFSNNEVGQALKELDFEIKTPADLPENVILSDALVRVINGEHQWIRLTYINANYSGVEFKLYAALGDILETPLSNDSTWSEVNIRNSPGYYGVSNVYDDRRLIWSDNGVRYTIESANLSYEQIVKIAKSLEER